MSFFSTTTAGRAETTSSAAGEGSARQLQVMAVLTTIFNVMALNGVLVIASLPLITAPAALQSAMAALDTWRERDDDRVVRHFIAALRGLRFWRTTVTVGGPLVAAALAVEEVIYFSRAANAGNGIGIGLGIAGLLLALASVGYLLLLGVRQPGLSVTDAWFVAVCLVARNLLVASPLLAGELVLGTLVLLRDPSLAVIGVPLGVLALVRVTALAGLRRMPELDVQNAEDREVQQ
jgi:hypothetical protein